MLVIPLINIANKPLLMVFPVTQRQDDGVAINILNQFIKSGVINYDTVIDDSFYNTTEFASYPIEKGTDISDNGRVLPTSVTFNLFFNNASFLQYNKVADVYTTLKRLQDSFTQLNVISDTALLENYVIETFNFTRDSNTGRSSNVNITFKKVIIVDSNTTAIEKPKIRAVTKQTIKAKLTKQPEAKAEEFRLSSNILTTNGDSQDIYNVAGDL